MEHIQGMQWADLAVELNIYHIQWKLSLKVRNTEEQDHSKDELQHHECPHEKGPVSTMSNSGAKTTRRKPHPEEPGHVQGWWVEITITAVQGMLVTLEYQNMGRHRGPRQKDLPKARLLETAWRDRWSHWPPASTSAEPGSVGLILSSLPPPSPALSTRGMGTKANVNQAVGQKASQTHSLQSFCGCGERIYTHTTE